MRIPLLKKKVSIIALCLIVLLGAFLRLYHFSDYLHFELDQARDTIFVSEAVKNGPQELPLLGPKASGTALRVGPAYYYIEYISALVFGNDPAGHAFFVVVLSIASIFIFYRFLGQFFNAFISLGLTYLFSISLFFVLFSRFSWNPNILPFFIIAGLYALQKSADKLSRHSSRWFLVSIFLFTIATQLHFIAFLVLPPLVVFFLAFERPKFSWKTWSASFFIIFILYLPVIANDIKFHGENSKAFFQAISEKNNEKHNFIEKLFQSTLSQSESYALILSGNDHIVTPKLNLQPGKFSISCADYCRKTNKLVSFFAIAFFVLGSILLFWQIRQRRKVFVLVSAWFILTFIIFTALAYDLPARFFLLVAPLPFILLGLTIEQIWKKNQFAAKIIFLIILAFFSITNLSLLLQRFAQMKQSAVEVIRIPSDNIIEEPTRVTLSQQQTIADFLHQKYLQNNYPINVVYAEPFYRRSIKYLADKIGTPIAPMNNELIYAKSNPVVILRSTNKDQKIFDKYFANYDISSSQQFGTLTVYSLTPKTDKINSETPVPVFPAGGDTGDILRITWKDFFAK